MEQIVKSLNSEITYLNHTIMENKLMVYGKIERTQASCPYCKMVSSHAHSTYKRTFRDLPVSIYETVIALTIQKFFVRMKIVAIPLSLPHCHLPKITHVKQDD